MPCQLCSCVPYLQKLLQLRLVCVCATDIDANVTLAAGAPMAAVVKEEVSQGGFPAAVLLPYLTYLVESLLRGEREMSKRLLNLVAGKFPQALYLPMRTSLLHLRDCVQKWMKEEERSRPPSAQVWPPVGTAVSVCRIAYSRTTHNTH